MDKQEQAFKKLARTMMQATARTDQPISRFWSILIGRLVEPAAEKGARRPFLDPRDLTDHMKRDMGYLDGNGSGRRRR